LEFGSAGAAFDVDVVFISPVFAYFTFEKQGQKRSVCNPKAWPFRLNKKGGAAVEVQTPTLTIFKTRKVKNAKLS
jgi:hypothetical protein